jgi:hypothetical protein
MNPQPYKCLHCDYRVAQPGPRCPMCGGAMLPDEQWSAAFSQDYNTRSFSLRSLLLSVTVVCVFLGAFRVSPGLAILLAIFAASVIARHYKPMLRWRRQAARSTPAGRVSSVVLSIVVAVGALVAGFIAFCTSCTALMITSTAILPPQLARQDTFYPILIACCIGGAIIAVVTAVVCYRRNSSGRKF